MLRVSYNILTILEDLPLHIKKFITFFTNKKVSLDYTSENYGNHIVIFGFHFKISFQRTIKEQDFTSLH